MGKATLENILEELKIDREERRKERKALEESIRGIQVQFTKTLSDRVKTLEKTFETFAENTNKSITVLGQLIGRVLDSQSSSISNIPAMKASFVSTMTNSHMINEKATRAVLIGFAEKQTPEETDLADLKTVSDMFRLMGDDHLLSICENVTFHRHPIEKREGARDRPIKIQFQNNKVQRPFHCCCETETSLSPLRKCARFCETRSHYRGIRCRSFPEERGRKEEC